MRPLILAAAALFAAPVAAHAETACADLAGTRLPHAEVTAASEVDGACRVLATSRPTPDSEIKIEVIIPRGAAWNGKYLQVGNGGLAGSIPSAQIRRQVQAGYAAAGTDDGHAGDGRSAEWA